MVDRNELEFPKLRARGLTQFARLSRRDALAVGGAALAGLTIAPWPAAAVTVDITQGNVQPMPIAIADFLGGAAGDNESAQGVSQIIAANLKRSGLFAPIDPAAFLEKIVSVDAVPRFPDWRTINAQALVTGRVTRQPDGRLKAEFRLWDVQAGAQLAGKQYFTTPENWRRIAHIISDAIYERLTGEKGYFDSRVVFVDETGPAERRIKRLAIMDQDGANVRYLTRGDELVLTPRFSPSTQEITYMAYGAGRPARLSAQYRNRPARDRRQLSGHELRAALLAGRPARGDESAGGQQRQHLRDGPALQGDDASHRHAGHRHCAVLLTRWRETLF